MVQQNLDRIASQVVNRFEPITFIDLTPQSLTPLNLGFPGGMHFHSLLLATSVAIASLPSLLWLLSSIIYLIRRNSSKRKIIFLKILQKIKNVPYTKAKNIAPFPLKGKVSKDIWKKIIFLFEKIFFFWFKSHFFSEAIHLKSTKFPDLSYNESASYFSSIYFCIMPIPLLADYDHIGLKILYRRDDWSSCC